MNKQERQDAVSEEQAAMTPEEVAGLMEKRSDFTLNLNSLPKHIHRWVDRGLKISCEGAGHPHHSHFKVGR